MISSRTGEVLSNITLSKPSAWSGGALQQGPHALGLQPGPHALVPRKVAMKITPQGQRDLDEQEVLSDVDQAALLPSAPGDGLMVHDGII